MPLLEAFVDENQLMRYKLTTLPKETAKLPILELANSSLSFNGAGITQTITPNTRNGVDQSYIFIIQDASIANITQLTSAGGSSSQTQTQVKRLPDGTLAEDFVIKSGTTTPVFLNETERKRSITITGQSVNVISRSITSQTSTNVTVIGADTGATLNLPITVKADPSKL
jgi:hypothetical protein